MKYKWEDLSTWNDMVNWKDRYVPRWIYIVLSALIVGILILVTKV